MGLAHVPPRRDIEAASRAGSRECESGGNHLVVRLDVQLNLLAGERTNSIRRGGRSVQVIKCACYRPNDDAIAERSVRNILETHLINIAAVGFLET